MPSAKLPARELSRDLLATCAFNRLDVIAGDQRTFKSHRGQHEREVEEMPEVSAVGEVWKGDICVNVLEVKEAGGGELVCCDEPMKLVT